MYETDLHLYDSFSFVKQLAGILYDVADPMLFHSDASALYFNASGTIYRRCTG